MDSTLSSFDVPLVGDGEASCAWAHTDDTAAYVCAMLANPSLSANRKLNVPSATVSCNHIIDALRRHSGKPVSTLRISLEDAHRFVERPDEAPHGLKDNTRFPVDFWFVIKTMQAEGLMRHATSETHNVLFPEVKPTSFDDFFVGHFGEKRVSPGHSN